MQERGAGDRELMLRCPFGLPDLHSHLSELLANSRNLGPLLRQIRCGFLAVPLSPRKGCNLEKYEKQGPVGSREGNDGELAALPTIV